MPTKKVIIKKATPKKKTLLKSNIYERNKYIIPFNSYCPKYN